MSSEAQFLIYFLFGMALVTFWHWIEKMSCLNDQRVNHREAALSSNPQASPAAGYHHAIDILPDRYAGLDRKILRSLPTLAYDASSATDPQMECSVCLSVFKDGDMYRELPGCKHTFHAECINMWFYSHSNCPLCRANVEAAVELTQPAVVQPTGTT